MSLDESVSICLSGGRCFSVHVLKVISEQMGRDTHHSTQHLEVCLAERQL